VHSGEDGLSTPPKKLQSLKLYGRGTVGKLPEWGLQNLEKLKLKRTRITEVDGTELPNLVILRLLDESFEAREPHHFSCRGEAFQSLTVLEMDSPCIGSMDFKEGTTPKLELLLPNGPFSISGLSYIPSLKEVQIYDYCRSELAEAVRAQLTSNSNKPVLKIMNRSAYQQSKRTRFQIINRADEKL
jgi:hypothetical protein